MMGVKVECLENLKEPFPASEIKWRVGATTGGKKRGIALAYIDARAVMDRLDEVCGAENWQKRYVPFNKDFVCEIGLNIDGVGWIWKADGAAETNFEATKGGLSDAFKRAAVSWGIGRYLYNLGNEWVDIEKAGKGYKVKTPPKLPSWALPKGNKAEADPEHEIECKMDISTYTTITQLIKHSEEARALASMHLKDCGYQDWDGLKRLNEEQGQKLKKLITEAANEEI